MFQRNIPKSLLPKGNKDKDKDARKLGSSNETIIDESKRTTRTQYMKGPYRYIFLLFLLWIGLIHYYERSVIKRAMKKCDWKKWEKWPKGIDSYKVSLFADPQIMDAHSYPGRPFIVNYMTKALLDNYHRKNWKYAQYYLDPDGTFFLGDLFDGGRYWDDDYWHNEYKRFNSIFPKKSFRKTVMSLPGNHDIGFGDTIIESSLERFTTYFGETSSSHDVGNHTIVLVDTISLSDTKNTNISSIPKQFLTGFAKLQHKYPRILLTHVPLWRDPETQTCGPDRESNKPFPLMKGVQYQTVIDYDISQEVLNDIQPIVLFSGDDHDYCKISHRYQANGKEKVAEEITVKSCAMNMGINRPAIQLLSLYNPSGSLREDTYQTNICYLPNPYTPLKMYSFMAILSFSALVFIHFFPKEFNNILVSRIEKTLKKEKDYLPLPVTMPSGLRTIMDGSIFLVDDNTKTMDFFFSLTILTIAVLLIFISYFTNI
ncbi:hypothetical protein TPHA_0L00890 [Tetrapisispora phaffii CBS 4417]|uniref:Calcineurin-like phosphoesterase domain-containing protein n=1 Tax=Tetrapisispora phaffii (strain ATCC 24235 / CBS 4417 / NBRC 1672 / NRRL Y-8282 / UCD 70-5) TaxID=1071381 RepID=G8BZW8_TETPH|nr:hypothetical protein TPHA_0L00890 [Tetrapisispora phaffii CBS 4417]CCE65446.1 hypothetical protein TPHA_0L00890 [Tetrapisispora phaffii CBS 4417]